MNTLKKGLALLLLLLGLTGIRASASVVTVYLFMAETCPICQSATLGLRSLYEEYHTKGVDFVAVFPNVAVSNAGSIEKFAKKYHLNFPMRLDENRQLTHRFSATVTPQVFVVNAADEVLYEGKIDNGFERVGKRRQVTTEHYLKDALDESLAGKPVTVRHTEPVGCFIIKN